MTHYTFTLRYDDATASVRLVETATLYDLADVLLAAIGFDLDHAFGFHSDLKSPYAENMEREYTLFADQGEGRMSSDTGVENTQINEVFDEGSKMLFHFDYGDDWQFIIQCTEVAKSRSTRKRPEILKVVGQFPEQYPDCEEWNESETQVGINSITGDKIVIKKNN